MSVKRDLDDQEWMVMLGDVCLRIFKDPNLAAAFVCGFNDAHTSLGGAGKAVVMGCEEE